MTRQVILGRTLTLAVGAAVTVAALGACGSDSAGPSTSASATTSAAPKSAVVADAECQQTPAAGHIDRTGTNLNFRTGDIRIAVSPLTTATPTTLPTPAPVPGAPLPPGATSTPATSTPAVPAAQCFAFSRWGNTDPSVPPDSLLFTFKDAAGGDGAQVSFFVGDLTGGALPPADGARRVVPALVTPINAQVGVSAKGTYYHATQCSLKLTAISSARTSGFFQCPTATSSDANPFAPSDDVSYDSDDPAVSSAPGTPPPTTTTTSTAPKTAALSGWFSVSK